MLIDVRISEVDTLREDPEVQVVSFACGQCWLHLVPCDCERHRGHYRLLAGDACAQHLLILGDPRSPN